MAVRWRGGPPTRLRIDPPGCVEAVAELEEDCEEENSRDKLLRRQRRRLRGSLDSNQRNTSRCHQSTHLRLRRWPRSPETSPLSGSYPDVARPSPPA